MAKVVKLADHVRRSQPVCFTRHELNQLVSLYSWRVIGGEWRDYAIGLGAGQARFSIYRAATDNPLYTVIKDRRGTHRDGDYVVCASGHPLKRGRSIAEVLSIFEPPLKLVSP